MSAHNNSLRFRAGCLLSLSAFAFGCGARSTECVGGGSCSASAPRPLSVLSPATSTSADQGAAGRLAAVSGEAPGSAVTAGTSAVEPPSSPPGGDTLSCANGVPTQLPAGYEVIASDVAEYTWSVSGSTVSWLTSPGTADWTLWRKRLDGAEISSIRGDGLSSGPDTLSSIDALTAAGGDVFVRESDLFGPTSARSVTLRLLPSQGPVSTLAQRAGNALGDAVADDQAIYWLGIDADLLTAWRTPRTAADSRALGALPFAWSTSAVDHASVKGLVAIGDQLYGAISNDVRGGQVTHAAKDGSSPFAPLGPALTAISSLATDGTDLFVVLEPKRDDGGAVTAPARIVRMTTAGDVHEITQIEAAGVSGSRNAGAYLAVDSGQLYWTDNQQMPWVGNVWSAPVDGSRAPSKVFTASGHLMSANLFARDGDLYFALYCRVDLPPNGVSGRTHILRLRR